MLTPLVCPECRGNIQLDDEKEFGFCLYCGCKVVLTDNLKTKVVVTHDTELEATRKLLSNYLKQKDWHGVPPTSTSAMPRYAFPSIFVMSPRFGMPG